MEYWKREEKKLAYEWVRKFFFKNIILKFIQKDTENYVNAEQNRVEYTQKLQDYRAKTNDRNAEFPLYQKYLKMTVSAIVTFLAVIQSL